MPNFKQSLDDMNRNINAFFSFIGNKLKNFKDLSRGEQVSYGSIGLGLVLILVSIVLFVV